MSDKERVILCDGFAYCEVKSVYDVNMDKTPMRSKNGSPMISINWSVVDCAGNYGYIRDHIVASAAWKIKNLQNALGIEGLYNSNANRFNHETLIGRGCGATILKDENPKYGSKIVTYVPMPFFTHLNKQQVIAPQGADRVTLLPDRPLDNAEDDDIPF